MSTTMLYRAADVANPEVWGLKVEHKVFDAGDVDSALDEGWKLHPRDVEQPADPEAPAEAAAGGKGRGRGEAKADPQAPAEAQ